VKPVRLSAEAIDEVLDASVWYRAQRPGLEAEFLAEVEGVLPLIGRAPASFPRLLDLPEDLMVRRALLPRFPYAVIFMDLGEHVRVLAVAHAKRRPGYWLDRLARE
jgi:plasmid stabilization system protein ParE